MLTEEKRPYELLVRWDTKTGAMLGAHVGFATVIRRDGEFVTETIDPVEPVDVGTGKGFPLADILDKLQITALERHAVLERQVAATEQELTQERQRAQDELDARAKAEQRIAELEAQQQSEEAQPK
jgi:hypothetical protein